MTDLQAYLRSSFLLHHMKVSRILHAVPWQEGYLVQDSLHALNTVDSLKFRLGHFVDVPIPAQRCR